MKRCCFMKNNTRAHIDMNSSSFQPDISQVSAVNYQVEQEKKTSISTSNYVLSCLLYKHTNCNDNVLNDFPKILTTFQRFSKSFPKVSQRFPNIFRRLSKIAEED